MFVRSELLAALAKKSANLVGCDAVKTCRILQAFGRNTCFHLHGRTLSRAREMLYTYISQVIGSEWERKILKIKKNSVPIRLPLWSSGQSSWLQIPRSRVWFPTLISWEVVGLERGPISLASTIEELLKRKGSSSGLEIREYGRRNPSRRPRDTLFPQKKLALTSPTSSGCSDSVVSSRTKATEIFI
jgi:hypothetical protein